MIRKTLVVTGVTALLILSIACSQRQENITWSEISTPKESYTPNEILQNTAHNRIQYKIQCDIVRKADSISLHKALYNSPLDQDMQQIYNRSLDESDAAIYLNYLSQRCKELGWY